METLGTLLNSTGSSMVSFEYRAHKAESRFWAKSCAVLTAGGVVEKLKAWRSGPGTSAAFGAGNRHVTAHLLWAAKRWEFKWLRKALRLKRRRGEGQLVYNSRTSALIQAWAQKATITFLHHRVFQDVFKRRGGNYV